MIYITSTPIGMRQRHLFGKLLAVAEVWGNAVLMATRTPVTPWDAHEVIARANNSTRPKGSWRHRYHWWLRISDSAVVTAVVFLAQTVRFGSEVTGASLVRYTSVDYWMVSVGIVAMWLGALTIYRTLVAAPARQRFGGNAASPDGYALGLRGACGRFHVVARLDIARGYLAIALPLGAMVLIFNRWAGS